MATVEKVSYQRLYSTGEYENERIGLEASIDPGEDVMKALQSLKEAADKFMKRSSNPYSNEASVCHYTITEEKTQADLDFDKLKTHLSTFNSEKAALAYLETTEWKYSFEAKSFIIQHFQNINYKKD